MALPKEKNMGVCYWLVNQTRREVVLYQHIPAWKELELAGNPVAASITTWYLLRHPGDRIAFVSDCLGEWPLSDGNRQELDEYTEVTDRVVTELIEKGILRDDGIEWADEDEPDTCYLRALTNIWMNGGARPT